MDKEIIINGGEHDGRRGRLTVDEDGGSVIVYIGPCMVTLVSWDYATTATATAHDATFSATDALYKDGSK